MGKVIPEAMRRFILPFNWEVRLVWALEAPEETVPIGALAFLLENPFWSRTPRKLHFDLRPDDVLRGRVASPYHAARIERADTRFALDLIRDVEHGAERLFILDGIHRLAKLSRQGAREVRIRAHPMSVRPEIEVDRTDEE